MPADRTQQQSNTGFYPPSGGAGTQQTGDTGFTPQTGGARGSTTDVKEKVQQVASETQHRIGDQLRSGIDRAKERTASSLDGIAQSLVQSSQQAREQDPQAPAQYVERVGRELQRASDYLRRTELDQVVRQAEDFARRQPALFLGTAFAIGLLGARFIKSSQRAEQQERFQRDTGFSAPSAQGQLSDRERPVSGFREPDTSSGAASTARTPADIRGTPGSPEWSGTPGGFSDRR